MKAFESARADPVPALFAKKSKLNQAVTANVFRCAYNIAKLNRPYSDMVHSIRENQLNGADMGVTLHSRTSATEIISTISSEMKKKLTTAIISDELKISVIIDESTSISNKSVLALYVRTTFPRKHQESTDAYSFPLGLVELDSLSTDHITSKVLDYLKTNGFTNSI